MSEKKRAPIVLRWHRALREADLDGTAKLVGFTMATYADADGGNVRPGDERLARECGNVSTKTVSRARARLCAAGWLVQESVGRRAGTRGVASVFSLHIPKETSVSGGDFGTNAVGAVAETGERHAARFPQPDTEHVPVGQQRPSQPDTGVHPPSPSGSSPHRPDGGDQTPPSVAPAASASGREFGRQLSAVPDDPTERAAWELERRLGRQLTDTQAGMLLGRQSEGRVDDSFLAMLEHIH